MSYDQKPVPGPFKGIVDNLPPSWKPDGAWDDLNNLLVRRGRLIGRPVLNASTATPDGKILRNLIPFTDILGNLHDLALTTLDAYMLTPGPVWNGPLLLPAWDNGTAYLANAFVLYSGTSYFARQDGTGHQPDTSPTYWAPINGNAAGTALPWGYAISQGRVYFANGSFPGLYSDGEATIKGCNHPGSWRYCMVLANHLMTAFTTEPPPQVPGATIFPWRVRWSDVGDPTDWIESLSTSAGHADLLEVPDVISGLAALGRSGYVYRPNGITVVTATGIGSAPFQFDQWTNAPKGVGVFYPYTLDVYGQFAMFTAEQDIYIHDGTTLVPIGGEAKTKIFKDISLSDPSKIWATFLGRFNPSFEYLSYWLSIPDSTTNIPVVWIYSFDDNAWQRLTTTFGQMTALARLVL